ncbi:hypothetical protein [Rhodococcus sp. SORGH_AS_0301]|uniref:hypothetical protein n=1 Tax=Rhodococcus sp. SORGH_AS_0301 TaxID=3041780 RepID=UPI0027D851F8|nr:hypothetical protein [Rhodococcus sp. SORGH_AS_0301]
MSLLDDVNDQIDKTIKTAMTVTERPDSSTRTSVPEPADIGYNNGKLISCTYLYTDMHDSSTLAATASKAEAARVFRGYLNVSTKIIRSLDGHIRSFDGDRVMGVFNGSQQGRPSRPSRHADQVGCRSSRDSSDPRKNPVTQIQRVEPQTIERYRDRQNTSCTCRVS